MHDSPMGTGIFIVASNRLVREALARALHNRPEFVLFGTTSFTAEALGRIVASRARILLFDPPTKSLAEFDFIREVRRTANSVKVLLVGMTEEKSTFLAAVQAGASGYVLEDAPASEIVGAAQALLLDEAVCPPRLCHTLFEHVAQQSIGLGFTSEPRPSLTRRQLCFLRLLARGLSNKEIAAQLNLSEQTVKNQIHRMLDSTQADNRMALVEVARKHGLLS